MLPKEPTFSGFMPLSSLVSLQLMEGTLRGLKPSTYNDLFTSFHAFGNPEMPCKTADYPTAGNILLGHHVERSHQKQEALGLERQIASLLDKYPAVLLKPSRSHYWLQPIKSPRRNQAAYASQHRALWDIINGCLCEPIICSGSPCRSRKLHLSSCSGLLIFMQALPAVTSPINSLHWKSSLEFPFSRVQTKVM